MLIAGNLFSLIGALLLVRSIFPKSKHDLVKFQMAEVTSNIVANLFLMGWSGAIVSLFALARNSLVFFKRGNRAVFSVLLASMFALGLYFNNRGLVGLLPVTCSLLYSSVMCSRHSTARSIKKALLVNTMGWGIYNFTILAIPSLVANIVVFGLSVYNLVWTKELRTDLLEVSEELTDKVVES